MRFWDSSAIVPLLVPESTTPQLHSAFGSDPVVLTWWASSLECVSALSRRERQGELPSPAVHEAVRRLDVLAEGWHEIQPTDQIRRTARRLLRVHDLTTADSLQLAAALVAAEDNPASLEFVSLDDRLSEAARREGFALLSL